MVKAMGELACWARGAALDVCGIREEDAKRSGQLDSWQSVVSHVGVTDNGDDETEEAERLAVDGGKDEAQARVIRLATRTATTAEDVDGVGGHTSPPEASARSARRGKKADAMGSVWKPAKTRSPRKARLVL